MSGDSENLFKPKQDREASEEINQSCPSLLALVLATFLVAVTKYLMISNLKVILTHGMRVQFIVMGGNGSRIMKCLACLGRIVKQRSGRK